MSDVVAFLNARLNEDPDEADRTAGQPCRCCMRHDNIPITGPTILCSSCQKNCEPR